MRVLIFGATGSAGGSVLSVCLSTPLVEDAKVIARRPLKKTSAKLSVFEHQDYLNFDACAGAFQNVDACFFCLGISVTQVSGEVEYRRITQGFALAAASAVKKHSPDAAFHYVSGQGTNAKSRFMWSRVKAETESLLMDGNGAVCWRPAAIDGEPSESQQAVQRALRPLFKLLRPFRNLYVSGEDLGRAMLQATVECERAKVIENSAIRDLAERADF